MIVERHRLQNTEYVDIEVTVSDEGDVWVQFEMAGGPYFRLSVEQLSEVVSFVERHADVCVQPELVRE